MRPVLLAVLAAVLSFPAQAGELPFPEHDIQRACATLAKSSYSEINRKTVSRCVEQEENERDWVAQVWQDVPEAGKRLGLRVVSGMANSPAYYNTLSQVVLGQLRLAEGRATGAGRR